MISVVLCGASQWLLGLPSIVYSTYILVKTGNRVFNSRISVDNIALHHSSLSVYPIVLNDIAFEYLNNSTGCSRILFDVIHLDHYTKLRDGVTYRDNQRCGPLFLRSTEACTRQPSLPAARVRSAPYLGTAGNLRHTPCLVLASWMLGYIVVRLITHVPFVPLCFCSPCSLVIILL